MKENKKTIRMLAGEDTPGQASAVHDEKKSAMERLKKPIIMGLMGIVFAGSMYLIFKPSAQDKEIENIGLNEMVPQATDQELQADKQKAYEQEMLEQKQQQKRSALTTLADYWKEESPAKKETDDSSKEAVNGTGYEGQANESLNSYRNAQSALGSFYRDNNDRTQQLQKQVEELKGKLAEKEVPAPVTVDDQLALMEKSYQMAAKYLPSAPSTKQIATVDTTTHSPASQNKAPSFEALIAADKNVVSTLYRAPLDNSFVESQAANRNFSTANSVLQSIQPKNSIKACVDQTQTVIGQSDVRLRLLEAARIQGRTVPKGTILTAGAKIQTGRLQLKVSSIEIQGNIILLDITAYDLDGQQGLFVPYSQERNALGEMAGNMSQQSGTSLMLTQSAGQQMAADLSRGVVQGISGYFSKKVRTPKVTLKAGHQLFLVSKK